MHEYDPEVLMQFAFGSQIWLFPKKQRYDWIYSNLLPSHSFMSSHVSPISIKPSSQVHLNVIFVDKVFCIPDLTTWQWEFLWQGFGRHGFRLRIFSSLFDQSEHGNVNQSEVELKIFTFASNPSDWQLSSSLIFGSDQSVGQLKSTIFQQYIPCNNATQYLQRNPTSLNLYPLWSLW